MTAVYNTNKINSSKQSEMSKSLRHLFFGFRRLSTSRVEMENLLETARLCIPPLDGTRHKGQAGRIGIVGGSLEYTGAPYFAGISALKAGADLVHVFCAQSAAPVIKSYSPELIVHPLLDSDNSIDQITPWLDRLHAIVIGPGLGREPKIFDTTKGIISVCQLKGIPLIIDADGLFLLAENPELFSAYPKPGVVLTPNKVEFKRLFPDSGHKKVITDYGENVSVLKKGSADEFENSVRKWSNNTGGSGRRCGGQGDLLSGTIAVFFHWVLSCKETVLNEIPENEKAGAAAAVACYAASRLVRLCNEKGFRDKGRSMLASDMIEHIHEAFEDLFTGH